MGSSDQVRLLMIEDVPQVAQYVRGLLTAQSQVRLLDVIADGRQALARIAEDRPDVVLVDALLQGRIRGMQIIRELHATGPDLPVVVLTVPQHPVKVDPSRGIDDVLAMPFNGYDLVSRVLGVHRSAVAAAERGPSRLVAVFSPKGGVGKTTIAFNLAVAAGRLGTRTVLVDGSIQFADLRALLRVPDDAPSMLDLPTDRISESDLADVLWRDPSGIDVLLAPPRIEMAEMVLARDLDKTISLLRRLYDLIVVDMGVTLDELNLALLDQADTILQIVSSEAMTLRNTVAIAETFAKIGYPPDKVRYLLSRADASGGVEPAQLVRALGREPEYRVRSEGQVVVPANNQGLPFVVAYPDAGVSHDVVALARELVAIGRPAVGATR